MLKCEFPGVVYMRISGAAAANFLSICMRFVFLCSFCEECGLFYGLFDDG